MFDHTNLRLFVIAAAHLLAMKIRAGRPTDADDIATVCEILGVRSVAEVKTMTRAAFADEDPHTGTRIELAADLLRQ